MMTITPLILVVVAIFSYVFVYFFSKVINPQASKKYVTLARGNVLCFDTNTHA